MIRICIAFLFCFTAATLALAQSNCNLRKEEDSIKVYTCHTDSSQFKSIVAEFTIHTSMDELAQFILKIENYPQWQYNTVSAKVIKKISESELIYRTEIAAPWPVTDRDMVVHLSLNIDLVKKMLIVKTDRNAGVMAEQSGFVRVPSSSATWTVKQKSAHELEVRYVMQIDPGGSVPAWLVNSVCAQAPYLSFKNLKAQLKKSK